MISRPVTFTIQPEGVGSGGSALARGSERRAVVVVSDVVSQLLSMESELSMGLASKAPNITPLRECVDHDRGGNLAQQSHELVERSNALARLFAMNSVWIEEYGTKPRGARSQHVD